MSVSAIAWLLVLFVIALSSFFRFFHAHWKLPRSIHIKFNLCLTFKLFRSSIEFITTFTVTHCLFFWLFIFVLLLHLATREWAAEDTWDAIEWAPVESTSFAAATKYSRLVQAVQYNTKTGGQDIGDKLSETKYWIWQVGGTELKNYIPELPRVPEGGKGITTLESIFPQSSWQYRIFKVRQANFF